MRVNTRYINSTRGTSSIRWSYSLSTIQSRGTEDVPLVELLLYLVVTLPACQVRVTVGDSSLCCCASWVLILKYSSSSWWRQLSLSVSPSLHLMMMKWWWSDEDILGTSCDQWRSMVQYCLTSTETRRLFRTDSPGRPPRLSHSSWTKNMSLHFNVSDKKYVHTYGRRHGVEGIRDHTCIHNSSSSHVRVNQWM